MIRKTTKGQYVFRDCDLLAYICGFSDVSDSARIARVCRGAFSAAIPFVWRQVEGVYNLLGLSPEIDISGPFENESCGLYIRRT
ncbi:hypothetical protein FRC12_023206 [Ceratobasidium sp. 428]|nr:hypothetical protein FRC12_023206 [Ceratobasidium sp. 428]